MKKIETNIKIVNWIKAYPRFGLELPNGWFGRPYDNIHKITWHSERDSKLIIEVDNQLYLIFTKPLNYQSKESILILKDWTQFVFDRQGYGDMRAKCDVFKSGIVKLIGYPNE